MFTPGFGLGANTSSVQFHFMILFLFAKYMSVGFFNSKSYIITTTSGVSQGRRLPPHILFALFLNSVSNIPKVVIVYLLK